MTLLFINGTVGIFAKYIDTGRMILFKAMLTKHLEKLK